MSSKSHSRERSRASSKSQNIARNITAFFLFLSVAALSLSCCLRAVMLNPDKHAEIFTNQNYVQSLYEDVKTYSYDLCMQSSIPTEAVDDVITYVQVSEIEEAYALGQMGHSIEYTQTTYEDRLNEFSKTLSASVKEFAEQNALAKGAVTKAGAEKFAKKTADYVKGKVEFAYMDKLVTLQNIGKTVSLVLIIVFVILACILTLAVFSLSDKKYRALRSVSHSFLAASLLQLLFVSGVQIIKQVKTLVIYPTYLCDSVMNFINSCIFSVGISALALFVISMVMITTVWKLKRNEK